MVWCYSLCLEVKMELEKIKFIIRKNKMLSAVTKPVYRVVHRIAYQPTINEEYKKLENRLKQLNECEGKNIWYLCVPIHRNLGDQAQKLCITNWLEENYPDHRIIRINTDSLRHFNSLSLLKKYVKDEDIFFFQSGYTFDGFHKDEEVHKLICDNFSNKVVFMPQTILYKSKKKERELTTSISAHKNTLLLARDKQSYATAVRLFKNIKLALYPDIVTTLIGKYKPNENKEGILFCIRNDGEKLYSDKEIDSLMQKLSKYKTEKTDTSLNKNTDLENDVELKKDLEATIAKYSKYKLVITDRYHGTIISLIAGTPVIILKTNDHKVTTGAEWFKGVCEEYVYVSQNLEEVPAKVEEMMSRKFEPIRLSFKNDYYDKLKGVIDAID